LLIHDATPSQLKAEAAYQWQTNMPQPFKQTLIAATNLFFRGKVITRHYRRRTEMVK
jgi:hypothetical protein